jgi:CheY-like chemotaxis protein
MNSLTWQTHSATILPVMTEVLLVEDGRKLASETVGTNGAACNRSRILLVDDEPTIRRLFRLILMSRLPNCQIDQASNGAEAIACFIEGRHAVLLMDLHMPVMDGQLAFGEISKLCNDRGWEMPSVVFCTGFAPPDSVMGAVDADSHHGLLLKPVTGELLVQTVRSRLLRNRVP